MTASAAPASAGGIPAGATIVAEYVLEPTTGKALPVPRGQVIHVEQVADGQCLDFNAYNLHDHKEYFHSLRTMGLEGAWPTTGSHLWSNPGRERPLLTIIADTVSCNDLFGARCSAFLSEYRYGMPYNTNCQDIFSEAIREWRLTPDDVHDSFNGFMNTTFGPDGRMELHKNPARIGDYLELLAQTDLLAVTVACGGSYGPVSNFETKGLKVVIYEATEEQKGRWLLPEGPPLRSQRTAVDFAVKEIWPKRALERDASYVPTWPWLPDVKARTDIPMSLSNEEMGLVDALAATGEWGDTPGDVVRAVFMTWWMQQRPRR
jgi:uncharacterized protein YcgI (DUF1989 family)